MYEEEFALIEKYISNKEKFVIFDVGAHSFSFGSGCCDKYNNCTSYGFEADEDTYNQYAERYINSTRKNYYNLAVSNNCSDTLFYPSSTYTVENRETVINHRDSGSICKPKIVDKTTQQTSWGVTFNPPRCVTTTTLSKFCEDNDIAEIDYLHIDVQGAENKVIEGLKHLRPLLIFAEINMFGKSKYDTDITYEGFVDLLKTKQYKLLHNYGTDACFEYNG